ncbi:MAG: hypothetical protein JSV92_02735 [archaeon]|nr:MAG: hypothetical protein JSV92_02735 [archaeon]
MNRIHNAVSILFSAPLIAAYVTIIFSLFSPIGLGSSSVLSSIFLGLIFLSFFPMFVIFLEGKTFTGWNFFDRRERNKVYPWVILSYFLGSLVFWSTGNKIMFIISASYVLVTLPLFLTNFFWKISVHTAGITGPITALVCVFGFFLSPLYLTAVPVAYSRYRLGSHDNVQLVAGALVAIFITYLTYFIMW